MTPEGGSEHFPFKFTEELPQQYLLAGPGSHKLTILNLLFRPYLETSISSTILLRRLAPIDNRSGEQGITPRAEKKEKYRLVVFTRTSEPRKRQAYVPKNYIQEVDRASESWYYMLCSGCSFVHHVNRSFKRVTSYPLITTAH